MLQFHPVILSKGSVIVWSNFCLQLKIIHITLFKMIKQLTQGVEISVQTRFLPAESSIRHGHYFFMYDITIENKNEFSVQLLSRHWHINDSNGEYREVKGERVVGEQPF